MFADVIESAPAKIACLQKPFATVRLGDYLHLDEIQECFDELPLDQYVPDGFRHKSIARMRSKSRGIAESPHGPLFQPKEYNPVHGDVVRHYAKMDARLIRLVEPLVKIFAACCNLGQEHEILVQAQRITACSGDDGSTGFPVVEGWHQDNTKVLGIFLVNRVNVCGGITMLSLDKSGTNIAFAQTLASGELLLVDDMSLWHNATPISKVRSDASGYRDVIIMTWPSCREPRRASRRPRPSASGSNGLARWEAEVGGG